MQLKPEALNALKLPVKVKAGFLGSVKLKEMETKLVERARRLHTEMVWLVLLIKVDSNKSWVGSLVDTVMGNLKLSISNIHIRYEDLESNPGHPFSAGFTLEKLLAVTVDENGKETFITGGTLASIQKKHPRKIDLGCSPEGLVI
ncbi:hypothetical protein YC2023_099863 [Brassica napus]